MKKYIYTALLTLGTWMFCSCDNIFKEEPVDKLTEESIWESDILLDEYSLAWYNNMSKGWKNLMSSSMLFRNLSYGNPVWYGDQVTYSHSNWSRTGVGYFIAGNESTIELYARKEWAAYYEQIQSINRLLENAGKIKNEEEKERLLGEAHFFRGYYYYMLLRHFGAPMLIDHLFDPLNDNEKFPRSSYEEMTNFIADEAQQAADRLPVKYDSRNEGRVTKGAALMLKAKIYFWVGSPAFQNKDKELFGFTNDRSKQYMQQAMDAYDQLIDLKQYRLTPIPDKSQQGIAEAYDRIFTTRNGEESILEYEHSADGIIDDLGHTLDEDAISPYFGGIRCAYCPTQNHVDEYGMQAGTTYDPQHPYENRDYRFYANILYDGSQYKGHTMDIHYTIKGGKEVAGVDLTKYGTIRTNPFTRTGYYMRKFLDPSTTLFGDEKYGSKQNYIIWRYAEVLLDYAEAAYRCGKMDIALKMINLIRERVHMPTYSSITLDQILNERRVELAFEETTYWDFFRLGTTYEKLNGETNPLKMIKIVEKEDGSKTYTISEIAKQETERVFLENENYYPIPWSEIEYHGIEQNPGWTRQE